jgi:hypothetical protein
MRKYNINEFKDFASTFLMTIFLSNKAYGLLKDKKIKLNQILCMDRIFRSKKC